MSSSLLQERTKAIDLDFQESGSISILKPHWILTSREISWLFPDWFLPGLRISPGQKESFALIWKCSLKPVGDVSNTKRNFFCNMLNDLCWFWATFHTWNTFFAKSWMICATFKDVSSKKYFLWKSQMIYAAFEWCFKQEILSLQNPEWFVPLLRMCQARNTFFEKSQMIYAAFEWCFKQEILSLQNPEWFVPLLRMCQARNTFFEKSQMIYAAFEWCFKQEILSLQNPEWFVPLGKLVKRPFQLPNSLPQ